MKARTSQQTVMESRCRLHIAIRGTVQGVGFRPFIFRLAKEMGLCGWVNNSSQGVFIEVEGPRGLLEKFLIRIEREKPPRSFIQSLESAYLDPAGFTDFEIRESVEGGLKTALVLPDIGTCPDCLNEIFDPANRRYLYPFTNCTNCGPRFSIIESLPYDRSSTTMKKFAMCGRCQAEYHDPLDRRFHAQPNACPECGPQLELWGPAGKALSTRHKALVEASSAIRNGKIVAVKGLGGFHLMIDASNEDAIRELRRRKHREEKPFALMFPSIESVRAVCEVSDLEERLLTSPESPIVLLKRRSKTTAGLSDSLAPGNPYLGVMLPYTPLHHLLMAELKIPVVATSGNLTDEPICIDEYEALERLGQIADLLLVHNRPIVRHVDDSIVRIAAGREMVMRRARGYAPLPIQMKSKQKSILACGAHLKNSVALSVGDNVFVSQHIGDLETPQAYSAFRQVIDSLENLYEVAPAAFACDLHPDYLSTGFAVNSGGETLRVQHHFAHILSCLAENQMEGPALGVAWDGTGLGTDGTIWGGEFLRVEKNSGRWTFDRFAHFRQFLLPGGETAVKQPRRSALGVLYEIFGNRLHSMTDIAPIKAFEPKELQTLIKIMEKRINCPRTSSAGRLFDAAAAILELRQTVRFEGQAAMELEFAAEGRPIDDCYPVNILKNQDNKPPLIFDWEPLIIGMIEDHRKVLPVGEISAKFHNTLVEAVVAMALKAGMLSVALSGGCFQNRYLLERAVKRLSEEGFRPYWHQRIPTNDGGIALGQIAAATY
ncbi:MAG: carbamoyltransferase HypF [Acidobacteria bacterium]|nr:carbamoyltransferase HypF [Acidobacteriota bacterium]